MTHSVRWYFHSTAMVRDYERARNSLTAIVGLRVLEDTVIEDPNIARRGGLTWIGDNSLELGQPITPGVGTDISVSRIGEGMHSIAVQVVDLDSTAAHLEALGTRVIRANDHVALSHPKDTGGVLVEWFSGELDFDPRFGGGIPASASPPLLDVQRMAFTGAVVQEPIPLARRLAAMTATSVTFEDPSGAPGSPHAAVDLVDHVLALYPLPDVQSSAMLWGTRHAHPRTHVLAVQVPDIAEARRRLREREIRVVRDDDHGLVIDPEATGRVPVLVVDGLLPGDPRAQEPARQP